MTPRRGGRDGGSGRGGSSGWGGRWFPPSRPLPVEEGIRSRSRRGDFAESWWGRRWIEALEGILGIGARLDRGKRYARKGQVLSIELEEGRVRASVQGSRKAPYRVEVGLQPLAEEAWNAALDRLAARPAFGARLLAGELPPEAEKAFRDAGAPLLPTFMDEVETACSCPDWSNPCKHVAAVHYLLAEELDRNPFLLFALRGLDRDVLVARLEAARPAPAGPDERHAAAGAATDRPEGGGAEARDDPTLPADPERFWAAGWTPPEGTGEVRVPDPAAPLLRRLGAVPFWRGAAPLLEEVEEVHRRASAVAEELLAPEVSDG